MKQHHMLVYQPGHFHAALCLRTDNPRLQNNIHVYAQAGRERDAFAALVERFQQRSQNPTHWILHWHEGEHLLDRLIADRLGDFVVLAGRNQHKLQTIAQLTQAGFHVLADKPWLTDSAQLNYLAQCNRDHNTLAMDLMTIRYEILSRLCQQVISTSALFGEFDRRQHPCIAIGSIHHLYKQVNGQPLQRPPWYYDSAIQGDGVVDIQSHMVDQAQWWVLGDSDCDFQQDVELLAVRRWNTLVDAELFHDSTGAEQFPRNLHKIIHDGVLHYPCNAQIDYRLRAIGIRQTAEWRAREPQDAGDMHSVLVRGTRCHIIVRQNANTGYKAQVHLQAVAGFDLETALAEHIDHWQKRFPGLSYQPSDIGLQLLAPADLDHGHESHFPLVLDQFFDYLDHGWPPALSARIGMRYTLLAHARTRVLQQEG